MAGMAGGPIIADYNKTKVIIGIHKGIKRK